jgi:hypothetical protein
MVEQAKINLLQPGVTYRKCAYADADWHRRRLLHAKCFPALVTAVLHAIAEQFHED